MFRWEYERYIAWEIEEVKRHVYQREPHERLLLVHPFGSNTTAVNEAGNVDCFCDIDSDDQCFIGYGG